MPSLDVFNSDAFSMQNLTAAVNRMPFKPTFLGSLGIFSDRPQSTTVAMVEEKHGKLALISTAGRGTLKDVRSREARQARPFNVPHVPYFQTLMADDIQNIRAFGSETELESVGQVINDQLSQMRQDHEVTHEWHRIGAIKGIVLDADGSTVVYNYYTEWGGLDPTTKAINFVTPDSLKEKANDWHRAIAANVGAAPYTAVVALCGDGFFDKVVTAAEVVAAYDRWRESFMLRTAQLGPGFQAQSMSGLDYADILFVNYRGSIGGSPFIANDHAFVFPVGVPNMFVNAIAPADMMGATNTRGQLIYAAQERLPFDKGVELHTQSNALYINTYPLAVVDVTGTLSA